MVGIEAMACGRPVVASVTGGIGDWLEPGVTGLGVKAGDAGQLAAGLGRILDDEALHRSMGRAARESVRRRFSESANVEALEQLYQATTEGRGRKLESQAG